jgi:hypothetical protein
VPVTSKSASADKAITVIEVSQGEATFKLLGETPMIQEAVGEKARRELLLPSGRKNATERATTQKHMPYEEFLASTYQTDDGPTALSMPATAFKDALRTAALDLTGVTKSEIGRLTYVVGDQVPIYGMPELLMSVVRSADINRTPDIRTRPIIPAWCAQLTVRFVRPKVNEEAITRLLVAAGMTVGIGGWRQEKGSGNYGLFRIASSDADMAQFDRIVAMGSRDVQLAALGNPECYDPETESLLAWYTEEVEARRSRGVSALKAA